MITRIDIPPTLSLDDYGSYAYLFHAVQELRLEAATLTPKLKDSTVWMLNSTAKGGGVAEMMPKLVEMMRDVGVKTEWIVMGTGETDFFPLTKRIHNLIHDAGQPGFTDAEKRLFGKVSRQVADTLEPMVAPNDILVVHDPQPIGVGAEIKRRLGVRTIWRCHIGLDRISPATESAWDFLMRNAETYDHAVFSAPEYIPPYLSRNASVLNPAIDPLSHKNRELSAHKLTGVLCNSGIIPDGHPVLTPHWGEQVMRLQPDGSFLPAKHNGDIGLLYRPVVTQVSRWDRLKGWRPLVEGFLNLKKRISSTQKPQNRHDRRLEIARLVLAGPDPAAIQDDPEGRGVLEELCQLYLSLTPDQQRDIALLTLPMTSRKENALMVNALQRCSSVIAQNSIEEGFGLTATEGMWKRIPVLATNACGLRQQVRPSIDGLRTENPKDPVEIADNLEEMLSDPVARDRMGRNAQRRVYDHFLVFRQVHEWLMKLVNVSALPVHRP